MSLPGGGRILVPLLCHARSRGVGECLVVKDGGDDPDVTHGAEVGARVRWLKKDEGHGKISLIGGEGVGRVTKPGLAVPVGEPAINPVPRRMIRRALREALEMGGVSSPASLEVEIFVPRGVELARSTLNPRLGILGGISILGTTGLVKPYSHEAYRATVLSGLRVARAMGLRCVVLSTGGKSEGHARSYFPDLPEEAFVQMGDYVRFSVQRAGRMGFPELVVVAFFGKALKIARGLGNTHASRGGVNLKDLARWTIEETAKPSLARSIAGANTGREALEILKAARAWGVVDQVGRRMLQALRSHAGPEQVLEAMILDFSGLLLWRGPREEGHLYDPRSCGGSGYIHG